jgi:hypothetical protein
VSEFFNSHAWLQQLSLSAATKAKLRSGFENQIASHDMGVKPVFSVAIFPYRIPEPSLGIAELGAANVSKLYGQIDVGVVFRISHLNGQIATGKFEILVSRYALH